MFRKNIIVFIMIIILLMCGCDLSTSTGIEETQTTISKNSIIPETGEFDISILPRSEYYFDDNTNTLIYFAKALNSKEKNDIYKLVLMDDNQKKKSYLSMPLIPDSFVLDKGWLYFTCDEGGDYGTLPLYTDPNFKSKQKKLKEISPYFGETDGDGLYRANLETQEIQWLGSSMPYVLDDKYIYFLESPVDLDKYGDGNPKGCVIQNNSLCRMEKDGSNPVLIQSEVYSIKYITDKHIYTEKHRIDKSTLEVEEMQALGDEDEQYTKKVFSKEKMFYTEWDDPITTVFSRDLTTGDTVKIAEYKNYSTELSPLEDGGVIIWQSNNQNREMYQIANIHFFDREYKLEKTIKAKGRNHITVCGDKVFYLLEEINDGKSALSYLSGTGTTYTTHTLCSDDLSMQGKNVTRIDIIDDSVNY